MSRAVRVLFAAVVAVLLAVPTSAVCAKDKTITIWADEFKIDTWDVGGTPSRQDPDTMMGDAHFYAILDIPMGAVIKSIRLNYNNPAGSGFDFCAFLRRKAPAALAETLIDFNAPVGMPEGTGSVQSDASNVTGPLGIRPGYRYYIQIEPSVGPGSINSVQVNY